MTFWRWQINSNAGLRERVFQLLKDVQIINQQDDVLLHYQREYDADWQRLWSLYNNEFE